MRQLTVELPQRRSSSASMQRVEKKYSGSVRVVLPYYRKFSPELNFVILGGNSKTNKKNYRDTFNVFIIKFV